MLDRPVDVEDVMRQESIDAAQRSTARVLGGIARAIVECVGAELGVDVRHNILKCSFHIVYETNL